MLIKTVKDYYDQVAEAFPDLPKKDVEKIMNFGFKSLYLCNAYGGDVLLKDDSKNKFLFYVGKLTYDSLKHFNYYVKKVITKIRILYNRRKIPWDGYYYFAVSDDQYENWLSQQKSRGRKRKYFKFDYPVMMYRIYDECKIANYGRRYFFKIATGTTLGFKYYKSSLTTDKAEFMCKLDSINFDRIKNETRNCK